MAKDSLYDLLGVSQTASLNEIKRAYRDKIRQYHPDNYAAERSKLQREGYTIALDALDREIDRAKQLAQKFNQAYSVLSDVSSRAAYDQELASARYENIQRQVQRKRQRHPEHGRRTVKQRPHNNPARPPTLKEQSMPWLIMGGLMIMLLFIFSNISGFLWQFDKPYVPKAPTAEGVISANMLQATEDTRQATFDARTQIASLPTPTLRPLRETIELADLLLFQMKHYEYAIEQYTNAISLSPNDANLYYKRGLANAALYDEQGDEAIARNGITDFAAALNLNDWAEPYQARGLLQYALWQQTGDSATAASALDDLQQFVRVSDNPDNDVLAAIANLEN